MRFVDILASCSDSMVCMQANRFSETWFCWKAKAEFRASLTQSGPKLTLGLVDVHNNERRVRKRAFQHLKARFCMNQTETGYKIKC